MDKQGDAIAQWLIENVLSKSLLYSSHWSSLSYSFVLSFFFWERKARHHPLCQSTVLLSLSLADHQALAYATVIILLTIASFVMWGVLLSSLVIRSLLPCASLHVSLSLCLSYFMWSGSFFVFPSVCPWHRRRPSANLASANVDAARYLLSSLSFSPPFFFFVFLCLRLTKYNHNKKNKDECF